MSEQERHRPVLHDAELGRPASAAWLSRRLAGGARPRVRGVNLGLDPQLADGESVELVPCALADVSVGDVVLASKEDGLRLLRVHGVRADGARARADVETELLLLSSDEILARAPALRSRWQALSSRWLRFRHRWSQAARHHRRHYLQDARAADASVEQRYEDAACVAGYVRKAPMGFGEDERRLIESRFPATGRVLVGGCAAGRLTLAFADRGHEVLGVDLSEPMLEEARRLSEGRPIEYLRARLEEIDPRLGPFEAAMLGFFVHGNVPGRESRVAMLRRLRRLLVPGGILLLSVRRYRGVVHWLRLNVGLLLHGGKLRELGDYSGHDLSANYEPLFFYYHFFTRRELAAELREAGFEPLEQTGVFAIARAGSV